jgi:hypothetical protein
MISVQIVMSAAYLATLKTSSEIESLAEAAMHAMIGMALAHLQRRGKKAQVK